MKSKVYAIIAAAALLLAATAHAQQPPPSKSEPPKPKAKKVWTNEDMGSVRKAADVYEDDKAKAAEEEAARKKAEAAKAAEQPAAGKAEPKPEDFLPKTVEEAEKAVGKKQYEIDQQYEAIELVKKEQAQAKTEESRAAFQKRIDTLTATLEEAVGELRAIDARLKELKAKPPAPPKAEPPKPEKP